MTENHQDGQPASAGGVTAIPEQRESGLTLDSLESLPSAGTSSESAATPAVAKTGRERQLEALAKHGKGTQFKQGWKGNVDAARTNSIRAQVRYLAKSGKMTKDKKTGNYSIELPDDARPTQLIAAQAICDSLNAKTAASRIRFIEYLTDQVDGKLVQPNLNADLAAIRSMNEDELDAIIGELEGELNGSEEGESPDSSGEEAP